MIIGMLDKLTSLKAAKEAKLALVAQTETRDAIGVSSFPGKPQLCSEVLSIG